ncbi:Stringent starvation protein B [Labrys sp. KNU-23]|uniref:SspB family protein n=1 Tax=Labrys sp. KNU-23 TaxID=2789216 RepID=UPI0011F09A54|nr:ClpXP protease specificity-enhancing factor SspB [Labrys sp. KNU-23]QEN87158.1 Stringent starvation protein B [Labrys sp. KNU-23]
MSIDHIRYDLLTQDALRGMVRRVLADAARIGLPGDHHFFISFKTQFPGVSIPARLAEKFPEEITIVLQHQFWDLTVSDYGFEVGLSFGNAPERLIVPFAAMTAFFDPSVDFGVKFEVDEAEAEEEPASVQAPAAIRAVPRAEEIEAGKEAPAKEPASKSSRKKASPATEEPSPVTDDAAQDEPPAESEKIVSLDHFRKKK